LIEIEVVIYPHHQTHHGTQFVASYTHLDGIEDVRLEQGLWDDAVEGVFVAMRGGVRLQSGGAM